MKPTRMLGLPEFVALMAVMFATLAFSIDAMLPAFPEIAAELTPNAINRAQLVLTAFVLGMGLGTIFTGPLSDAFGRKPVITIGVGLYIVGAALAFFAQSLEFLLAARVLQGIGASGPRIVPMAMTRDLYEGRRMAQISSFVMTIFMIVPAVAPSIGAVMIDIAGWRSIFLAFIVFALIAAIWMNVRQPETLAIKDRRPLNVQVLKAGAIEVLSNRLVLIYIVVMTLGFSQMFATISTTQQIYDETFGKADSFPLWFALTAGIAIFGTVLNAMLVMKVGMRSLAIWAYATHTVLSTLFVLALWTGVLPLEASFPAWFAWSASIFFMAGLTFGNLNALALQPLGHIAGMAASMIAAISTIASVAIAAPIGLAFDGTPVPLLIGAIVCSGVAFVLMRRTQDAAPQTA
jgi:DHA1 family bicyclomycin/chloramphenicol resistance-like MFS transporter